MMRLWIASSLRSSQGRRSFVLEVKHRHCERSEAIQSRDVALGCFVATLFAVTTRHLAGNDRFHHPARRSLIASSLSKR
jgi:hypothetical protein